MRRRLAAMLFLLSAGAAVAGTAPFVCGTSPRNDEQQQALARQAAGRRQKAANALTLPSGYVKDNVAVVKANDLNAPFSHPIDLAGKTLTFTKQNFFIATGGRAAVSTAFTPFPPRKRRIGP